MSNIEVSNTDDVIDSRDVIFRIEFLTGERDAWEGDWAKENEEEATELAALIALAEEAKGSGDWEYGETLIRGSYFSTYAQELAEAIELYDPKAGWPHNCIDWDKAARELKHDYTSVSFDGVTYLIRD